MKKKKEMIHKIQFITVEEDDKDLIVSFAIDDYDMGVKSLILHRTLFFEHIKDDCEKGVKVSLEDDHFDKEDVNMLESIKIIENEILIKSTFREYHLDISMIDNTEIENMLRLLKKQNHDKRFNIMNIG